MSDLENFAAASVELYRRTLVDDIVPFWMRHALDPSGALNNCLDDAGAIVSHDRFLWSQGRALWTFSTLWNRVERRQEWLDVAHGLARWLLGHGRDAQSRWVYRLDDRGNVMEGPKSIYVDGFVMCGLTEYTRATGDAHAIRVALETWENVRNRLARPGSYDIAPYRLPEGMKALGVRMIFSWVFHNLGRILARPEICADALGLATELLDDFADPDSGLFREFALLDGGFDDAAPEGRVCIPCHVIEAMWFLIALFEDYPEHENKILTCCRIIKKHLEAGWDDQFGGLRSALDVTGREPVGWQRPDCKPWWAQLEAMVATAYALKHTGEAWCRQWHERVRDYAFARYPVATGEWRQWLDREGNPCPSSGLPVKDPFHLPRALIVMMEVFAQINRPARGKQRHKI